MAINSNGPTSGIVRILVVDDSAFMRTAISKILSADPGLQVIDTAKDGQEGLDKAKRLKPDLVTLDIEMPVMNGLTALARIKAECSPAPVVLVCSSLTSAGSHEALKALRLGAADVIAKDHSTFTSNTDKLSADLIAKIKAVVAGRQARPADLASKMKGRLEPGHQFRRGQFELVVVGSSTGGPPALESVFEALPRGFPTPVVVAQHMPALFTKSLAERFERECQLEVVHADRSQPLLAGTIYVCPGGQHGRVRSLMGRLTLEVSPEPTTALYKPSVNELFGSAAEACGGKTLAVILTGMGDDGMLGARSLKAKGATILAQDMQSCVVYGMPKAVAQAGLADGSMTPAEIGAMVATVSGASGIRAA